MRHIIVFAIFASLAISGCTGSHYETEQLESLATCLADSEIREYGAFWCPNCADQAKMFGPAEKIIKDRGVYVECDPRGENADPELCLQKGIKGYPTWEFPDGTFRSGVQQLETLAELADCEFDSETQE